MTPPSAATEKPSLARSAPARLLAVETAAPPFRVPQEEVLGFILKRFGNSPAAQAFYKRVFRNESVKARRFALENLDEALETDHEKILARFERAAVALSAQALRRALASAGLSPLDIDYVAVTTCTGYLCPGLSAYLVEAAALRPDVHTADLVGMGCGAALPALEQAANFLAAHPGAKAAVVCTEICSAALFNGEAPDLIISNALFADGSAAAILTSEGGGGPAKPLSGRSTSGGRLARRSVGFSLKNPRFDDPFKASPALLQLSNFASLTVPEWRDTLRFRTEGGHLRNVLTKEVPAQAGKAMSMLVPRLLKERGLAPADVGAWVFHAGGEKILDAVQEALTLPPGALAASRRVLRDYGNMSSPTVLFALKETLAAPPPPGGWGVLASFGAGFSAHGALLEF